MKKIKKILYNILLSTFLILNTVQPVFAYDWDVDNYTDEGYFIVDNEKDRGSSVILYILVDKNNRDYMYTAGYFEATMKEGNMPEGRQSVDIIFKYKPENKKIVTTIDGYEVWAYQFSIENGTYIWANAAIGCGRGLNALKTDYTLPVLPEDYQYTLNNDTEEFIVNNQTVHIYTILAGKPQELEVFDEYVIWAMNNDGVYKDLKENSDSAQADEIIEVIPDIIEDSKENTEENLEETIQPTPTPKVEISEVIIEEENENNIFKILLSVICVAVIAWITFVYCKKK